MSTYSSKPVVIDAPIDKAFDRLSDFSAYQDRLEQLPSDLRARIGDVKFTPDAIVITAAPVGEMVFEVVERKAPSHVALQAKNSPVPMKLLLDLTPGEDADHTTVVSTIDVDIPVVLRPMVGGKMQEAADKFSELVSTFFRASNAEGN